ncbi:hypothetical protein [Streptomyces violascens]|uniref:hypothetical protein n=1 Tax=Streptomyces violascens TaxID=67381 RepID=UPI0036A9E356
MPAASPARPPPRGTWRREPGPPHPGAKGELGNEYTDWGGAFGPAADGSRSEGTATGQPALPDDAHTLHLRLTFLQDGQEYRYELSLPVSQDG